MFSSIIDFFVSSPFVINLLLLLLIILDVVLSVLALLLPNTWFKIIPQSTIYRSARASQANWSSVGGLHPLAIHCIYEMARTTLLVGFDCGSATDRAIL